jgi:putative ABC transport system substrate-binding protein
MPLPRLEVRRFVALTMVCALLGLVAFHAEAQPAPKLYRIGVVTEAWAANHPTVLGLKSGLRELGLEEGRDVAFDVRFTQGKPKDTHAVAKELVKDGVDLLFASGVASSLAAKAATSKLPIVFAQVNDPVATGIVKELVHPGSNITGVFTLATELMPKRLEVLKTLQPDVRRVWFVHAGDDVTAAVALARLREVAQLFKVDVISRAVEKAKDVEAMRNELQPGDALLVPDAEALFISAGLLKLSLVARIPAVFPSSLWVGYGGLVSYGSDYFAQGIQAARLVAKIRNGAQPGELAVEGVDVIDLAVNLGTAGLMRINVPQKILLRADTIRR